MTDKGYDEQNMIAAMNREKMTDCTPECQYASIYLLIFSMAQCLYLSSYVTCGVKQMKRFVYTPSLDNPSYLTWRSQCG